MKLKKLAEVTMWPVSYTHLDVYKRQRRLCLQATHRFRRKLASSASRLVRPWSTSCTSAPTTCPAASRPPRLPEAQESTWTTPVSYTHLDVYKRQLWDWATQPFNSVILTFVWVSLYLVSDSFLPDSVAAQNADGSLVCSRDADAATEYCRGLADLSANYGDVYKRQGQEAPQRGARVEARERRPGAKRRKRRSEPVVEAREQRGVAHFGPRLAERAMKHREPAPQRLCGLAPFERGEAVAPPPPGKGRPLSPIHI